LHRTAVASGRLSRHSSSNGGGKGSSSGDRNSRAAAAALKQAVAESSLARRGEGCWLQLGATADLQAYACKSQQLVLRHLPLLSA
jgi:hypothetical protein